MKDVILEKFLNCI